VEVLLGHMGGPFWSRKDDGAWSIPKGLPDPGEAPIDAARREFSEEFGSPVPPGDLVDLGEFRQSSKKTVTAWALELPDGHVIDVDALVSSTFEMEWPPRSGRMRSFPEIDRAAWFDLDTPRRKVVGGQAAVFDLLLDALDRG
jgi:predicted NUDIX family NTP pyrophosphohydrolase